MPKENESISLGKIGIVDGGVYDPKKTYNSGTFVLHNGSTWLAMKDNLTGATPEEGTNWKYLARGFASEMLSLITAIDSQGLLGSKGAEVTGQALIDKLADMAANKLIQKASMSNVQANDQNKVPTSALVYAMNRSITQNEETITQLNRDTVKTKENYLTSPYTITKTDLRTLNGWDPGMFDHIPTELKNQWIACITTSPYDNEISEASCQILIGMSDGTIAFRNGEVDGGKWKEFKVKHWT